MAEREWNHGYTTLKRFIGRLRRATDIWIDPRDKHYSMLLLSRS
jgi:hypothetical protein